MKQPRAETVHREQQRHVFRIAYTSYKRTRLLSQLLFGGLLLCAIISAILGVQLWPTYAHTFTLYLKWRDALVASLWFISFISLGGCVLVTRFLYALHKGYHQGMLTLVGDASLTVRDLSYKNLGSILRPIGAALACFIAAIIGFLPEMLIAWTSQLSHPALAVAATLAALVLSAAGLALALPAISFIFIGIVGCISFCRKMGALQTYRLSAQTTLRIDGLVLTIIYPDQPESMIDLNSLDGEDQRQLLSLLHTYWADADSSWNPLFGEEIEAALEEAEHSTVLV